MLSFRTLAVTVPMLGTSTIQLQDTPQDTTDKVQKGQDNIKTEKCHLQVRATARTMASRKEDVRDMMEVMQNGSLRLHPK